VLFEGIILKGLQVNNPARSAGEFDTTKNYQPRRG